RVVDRARQPVRLPVSSGEEPARRPVDPAQFRRAGRWARAAPCRRSHRVARETIPARRRAQARGRGAVDPRLLRNTAMLIIPAIDLKGGKCVRLLRGDLQAETVYGDDPLAMGRRWVDAGARYLHVVDLDGAVSGAPVNADAIAALCAALPI